MAIQKTTAYQQGERFGRYVDTIKQAWEHDRSSALAAAVREQMERLFSETPDDEAWLAGLAHDQPSARELYRDPDRGFIQMGHFHRHGHGGAPHDHGPCWVVYGVRQGEIEITTYRRTDDGGLPGKAQLEVIKRDRLTPGVARAYLPGEIHSTRAIAQEGSVVLRFLSADLEKVPRNRYNLEEGTVAPVPPSP